MKLHLIAAVRLAAIIILVSEGPLLLSQENCASPMQGFKPAIRYLGKTGFKEKCYFQEFTDPPPAKPKKYRQRIQTMHYDQNMVYSSTSCPGGTVQQGDIGPGNASCSETDAAGPASEAHVKTIDVTQDDTYNINDCSDILKYSGKSQCSSSSIDGREKKFGNKCPPIFYVYYESKITPTFTSNLSQNGVWSGTGTETHRIITQCLNPGLNANGFTGCATGQEPTDQVDRTATSTVNPPFGFPGFVQQFGWVVTDSTTMTGSVVLPSSDCNNNSISPSHQNGTIKLSQEFTTSELDTIARASATATTAELTYPTDSWLDFGTARYAISDDEFTCKVRKLYYHFSFPGDPGVSYSVTWSTVIIGENGSINENKANSWTGVAGSDGWCDSPGFVLDPPSYNCVGYVANAWAQPTIQMTGQSSGGGCCGGGAGQLSRSAGPAAGGPTFTIALGLEGYQTQSGTLSYRGGSSAPRNATPARLSVSGKSANTDVVLDQATGNIRQVKGAQILADVQTLTLNSFRVDLYSANTVAPKDVTGLYPVTGQTPFESWTATAPDAAASQFNRVLVTQSTGSSSTAVYEYLEDARVWTLNYPGNVAREKSWQTGIAFGNGNYELTQITEYWNPVNNVLKRRSEVTYRNP